MKKIIYILAMCFAIAAFNGCYKTQIISGAPIGNPAPGAYGEGKWHHALIYGLVNLSDDVKLHDLCPNGWADVVVETSFLNGFAGFLVAGAVGGITAAVGAPSPIQIWSAQSVTVRCASGTAFNTLIDRAGRILAVAPASTR